MKNVTFKFNYFRFFAVFLVLLSFSSFVFAFDFGGLLTNDSGLKSNEKNNFNLDQKASLSLWARQNFDKNAENYFAAEGIYNFEADLTQAEDKISNAVDLSLFELALSKSFDSSKITFNAGRFYFADLSGLILSQNADGAKLSFKNNYFGVSAFGAYTGLLNAQNTEIIGASPLELSSNGKRPAVQDNTKIYIPDSNKIYALAEKYALCDLPIAFPYFAANQSVSAEFFGAFSLENKTYNRMYATLKFEGPVYNSLFYSASSSFEFLNYKNDSEQTTLGIANLSKITVDYFFKNASLGFSGVYASGNQGALCSFVGFTKNTSTYSLQNFLYSGIIKGGLNASYKPVKNLLLNFGCDLIFNATAGSEDAEFEDLSGIEFYGFEYSAGATWQVMSDFRLGLSATQFFDKANSSDVKKTYINLHAVLAF